MTADYVKEFHEDNVIAWYYYSNMNAVLMLANNEWRDHHDIDETLVIINYNDLKPPASTLSRPFLGLDLDHDYIMVNQIMFTFRRETGYMINNSTSEQWLWHGYKFGHILLNPTYDFSGEYLTCISFTICMKFYRMFVAALGFMVLSFVNGLIVRVALLCSNVVIFPLFWLVKVVSG